MAAVNGAAGVGMRASGDSMTELKPSRELIRILGLQDESGNVHGLLIASQMHTDLVLATLKLAVDMLEKEQGQYLKDLPIKDPADIRVHKEM